MFIVVEVSICIGKSIGRSQPLCLRSHLSLRGQAAVPRLELTDLPQTGLRRSLGGALQAAYSMHLTYALNKIHVYQPNAALSCLIPSIYSPVGKGRSEFTAASMRQASKYVIQYAYHL